MAIPTVAQLAQSLMIEFGEPLSNSSVQAQYEEWIKDIFDNIGNETEWKYQWLLVELTTVAAQRLYVLEAFVEEAIIGRIASNDSKISLRSKKELVTLNYNLEQLGEPVIMYVEAYNPTTELFNIGFWPVPDTEYSIELITQMQPNELSSSTKLLFPRRFVSCLKDGVRARVKLDDGDVQAYDRFNRLYNDAKNKLKMRNNLQLGQNLKMNVVDIPAESTTFVRFPPNHFSN